MIHRHLLYAEDTEPENLPLAAVVDILDRGDLGDWAPLVRSILANPCGRLAKSVLRLVDEYSMYGTSPLWRAFLDRHRPAERASLADLRGRARFTQTYLAARLGISQSDLSKLERRPDVRLSTLRAFVEALGGTLELRVSIAAGRFALVISDRSTKADR